MITFMSYRLKIRTPTKALNEGSIESLVPTLRNSILKISKYDYSEPLKKQFQLENIADIYTDMKRGIILKGKNKKISDYILIDRWSNGITFWNSEIKVLVPTEDHLLIAEVVSLFKEINRVLPIIHGNFGASAEYTTLHKKVVRYDSGGSSESMEGVSADEFMLYLPGIYWMNFFCRELVDAIGRDKILSVDNIVVEEIGDGSILFYLNEPINPIDLDARRMQLHAIAKHLGEEYFFSLSNMGEIQYRHPHAFSTFLEKIRIA